MNRSKRARRVLRTLDDRQLAGVTGGVIGIIDEYKPSEFLRLFSDTSSADALCGGGPHV